MSDSLEPQIEPQEKPHPLSKRSAARLAAIQALYQHYITKTPVSQGIKEFSGHFKGPQTPEGTDIPMNLELFETIVQGVLVNQENIHHLITQNLREDWPFDRIELVLRVILEAGTFELLQCPDTPARIIVSEYVNLTHTFYDEKESGFVNGVLDKLAKALRP